MKRFIEKDLYAWKNDSDRKPLILSGARQVGKSYCIEKNFAAHFDGCVTINFEKQPEFKSCFEPDLNPQKILRRIEALSQKRIMVGSSLLFFDEVQACPPALSALRYFYEELPALHLVAAGSLLEFALQKISTPVGRVTFRYLTPLSFEEFLYNCGHELLLQEIIGHPLTAPFPEAFHQKAIQLLKEYLAVGGMPQVINLFILQHDYLKCQQSLSDLLESYVKDFPKYNVHDADLKYIDLVFSQAARLVGKHFKFVHIARDIQAKYIRKGVTHLSSAGVIDLIFKTHGVPLGANYNPDRYKLLFFDVGLMQRACGLNIADWIQKPYQLIHAGGIAEQFVGQEILASSGFKRNRLYYWEREKRGSSAEIDYLVEHKGQVIPLEVKSGVAGKLRSMHLFLESHPDSPFGVKVSLDNFSRLDKIQSIPLYAFGSWISRSAAIPAP